MECVEGGLNICFNTGRMTTLEGQGELFGPFVAPKGFYIDGLWVKPSSKEGVQEARKGCYFSSLMSKDYVSGIDTAPLPSAAEYDCPCALLYTAEQAEPCGVEKDREFGRST